MVTHLKQTVVFRDYQQAFEGITGLPLVLRAAGSFQLPLHGSKRVNRFCALLGASNQACAACLQLQQRVEEEAINGPKTLECFAGLNETAVPVRVGEKLVGFLQTGQILLRPPTRQRFRIALRRIRPVLAPAAGRALERAYFQTRVLAKRDYELIVQLLAIFAEHLATVSHQTLVSAATAELPAMTRARAFIAGHQAESLRLRDVARAVNMSEFYFCKLFKTATGLTFTNYLARLRTEVAKQMLLDEHMRVAEAAFAAGFQSLSQFNRVFRRIAGESPSGYRHRLHFRSLPLAPPLRAALA
jgi:AraC-like DNA-binding protein